MTGRGVGRRRLLVGGLGGLAGLAGCGTAPSSDPAPDPTGGPTTAGTSAGPSASPSATPTPSPSRPPTSSAPPKPELPRGGRTLIGNYRMVGYCGYPGAKGQGRLGIGGLDDRVAEIEDRYAKAYGDSKHPILPVLELIAVTVHSSPGGDGKYRGRTSSDIIETHLRAARRAKGYLLLNIQPGRADFLGEVKALERWLREPDVGVALDPEWAVGPGQIPGRVYGRTSGAELDTIAAWLSDLVARHRLPQKAMVYHQLHPDIIEAESRLREHRGVAAIKSVDGIGSPAAKVDTWRRILETTPDHVRGGFKLFYSEDVATGKRLMTPKEVLALKPRPDYVMYE